MYAKTTDDLGDVNINTQIIEQMVGLCAMECFGIVGMAPSSRTNGIIEILKRENLRKSTRILIRLCRIRIRIS